MSTYTDIIGTPAYKAIDKQIKQAIELSGSKATASTHRVMIDLAEKLMVIRSNYFYAKLNNRG